MKKKNEKTIDTGSIIKFFGGKHQIVNDFEKILRTVISVKTVEKWLERQTISTGQVLNLKMIAEKRGMNFIFEEYIK